MPPPRWRPPPWRARSATKRCSARWGSDRPGGGRSTPARKHAAWERRNGPCSGAGRPPPERRSRRGNADGPQGSERKMGQTRLLLNESSFARCETLSMRDGRLSFDLVVDSPLRHSELPVAIDRPADDLPARLDWRAATRLAG